MKLLLSFFPEIYIIYCNILIIPGKNLGLHCLYSLCSTALCFGIAILNFLKNLMHLGSNYIGRLFVVPWDLLFLGILSL